jgi:hypothetical protein
MELRKFDRFLAMMQPENTSIPNVKQTNNISDIAGAKPDAFGKLRNIKGRDYNNVNDIPGAMPKFLSNKRLPFEVYGSNNFNGQTNNDRTGRDSISKGTESFQSYIKSPSSSSII